MPGFGLEAMTRKTGMRVMSLKTMGYAKTWAPRRKAAQSRQDDSGSYPETKEQMTMTQSKAVQSVGDRNLEGRTIQRC
jgi:hypothetical protein